MSLRRILARRRCEVLDGGSGARCPEEGGVRVVPIAAIGIREER